MTERARGHFTRLAASLAGLLLTATAGLAQTTPPAPPAGKVTIGYVEIEGDERYEPVRIYERMVLSTHERPYPAAEVAIEESKIVSRATKIELSLEKFVVAKPGEVAAAILKARAEKDMHFFVVDAPAPVFSALKAALAGRDVLIFNPTAAEDTLRRNDCAREIIHTAPSHAMLMDGMVQYLISKKWRDVFVLEGVLPADKILTDAFAASMKKFGGRIVTRLPYKLGNDPREREENNIQLITSINRDYDIIFVADTHGEAGRTVAYRAARARPVIGTTGLIADAYHWAWERNGGPQLSNRIAQRSGKRMRGVDWTTWIAVKMVAQGILRTRSAEFDKVAGYVRENGFDGAKGKAVSVRKWDQQLRQPIVLGTPDYVAASAPIEGYTHQVNDFDSLGDDERDSPCRLGK